MRRVLHGHSWLHVGPSGHDIHTESIAVCPCKSYLDWPLRNAHATLCVGVPSSTAREPTASGYCCRAHPRIVLPVHRVQASPELMYMDKLLW